MPALTLLILPNPFWWLGLIVALIPWALRWRLLGYPSLRTPFDIPIILMLAGVLVGLYAAVDTRLALEATKGYIGAALGYYLLVNNDHPRWMALYLGLFAAVTTVATIWTFTAWSVQPTKVTFVNAGLQAFLARLPHMPWVGGVSPHLNSLASVLQVTVSLLAASALFGNSYRWQLLSGAWALLLAIATFLTSSRAAWLALLFSLLVLALRRTRWTLIVIPFLIGGAYLILRQEQTGVEGLMSIGSGRTLIDRTTVWRETWYMLQDLPFTGIGPANFPLIYPIYSTVSPFLEINNPHNGFLQLYSDTGILGVFGAAYALAVGTYLAINIFKAKPADPSPGRADQGFFLAIGGIAGAAGYFVYAIFESAIGLIFADASGQYHYIVSPFPWILAAFTVIGFSRSRHPSAGRMHS